MPEVHVVLQHADQESGDDVHAGDDDARDGIPLSKTRSAIHGSVELSFAAQLSSAAPGLGLVDQTAVQVGVDGHLFVREGRPG